MISFLSTLKKPQSRTNLASNKLRSIKKNAKQIIDESSKDTSPPNSFNEIGSTFNLMQSFRNFRRESTRHQPVEKKQDGLNNNLTIKTNKPIVNASK